jgi:signal transduction protein with GAF and PtsI domain
MGETAAFERHIEALTRISKAITSERYIEDILRLVVTVTAETMRSKICSLWLLDENDKALKLRATQSISEDYLKERSLKVGEGIVGKVALTREPRSVSNVLDEPDYKEKELAKKEGLVSMLSVPMVVKDRIVGVINCYTSDPHEFTETEKNVLTTVANEAAVAIENTELMVRTKVIQEELEARKLIERAKDLLMTRRGLSGVDAYRWIQRRSMDARKSMREISEAIILTDDM